ncbi:hypothetical protein LPN01_09610 [Sphingomonas sp. A2-49]|uniref:hypothetical protein n=1 Tax=Sphingomonas sp. A2-49 TaxID=1391375 RepID=UPI0021D072B6|nr:hypothetical protein [Sphingomonas sp. A2-49]MCU6454335.1 hypothetical protein [Sphingomonas sp. A2-49]
MFDEVSGLVAGVDRINAWLAVAKPGDRFIYASRCGLPRTSAGAARMRDLASRKVVLLVQVRSTLDPSRLNYTAVRTAVPCALSRIVRPRLTAAVEPIADGEAAVVDALLPVLERFARHGRPCPTDRQLAAKAGLTEDAVKAGLEAMISTHLIRVQGCAAPTYRRIIILSNGLITGIAA